MGSNFDENYLLIDENLVFSCISEILTMIRLSVLPMTFWWRIKQRAAVFKFQTAYVSYLTILCLYHMKIEFYFTDTEYSTTLTMHCFFDQENLFIVLLLNAVYVNCCPLNSFSSNVFRFRQIWRTPVTKHRKKGGIRYTVKLVGFSLRWIANGRYCRKSKTFDKNELGG